MGVALPDVAGTWVKSKRRFLSKLQTYTVQYSSHYAHVAIELEMWSPFMPLSTW